ncbi:putative quinol monooxygenase [Pseudomonas purpurea]|uniref:putative quinol monooxygenase n=1 Tax=Pseudomonas purpurea TaxID=3136737 RepID=UPI003263965F
MSEAFTAIATVIAKPGQGTALERQLRNLVAPSRAEAGCQFYDLHQDLEHADAFYVLERWDNEAALQTHNATAHFQAFQVAAAELIEHFKLKRLRVLG